MNSVQKIQLERVRVGSFNSFDGEKVAADLEKNEDAYTGFLFGRFGYGSLVELRDIAENYLNASTLMFLTTKKKLPKLQKLLKKWGADEVGCNYYNKRKLRASEVVTQYNRNKFMATGTAPYRDEQQLHMALGSQLGNEQVLVRGWWD